MDEENCLIDGVPSTIDNTNSTVDEAGDNNGSSSAAAVADSGGLNLQLNPTLLAQIVQAVQASMPGPSNGNTNVRGTTSMI